LKTRHPPGPAAGAGRLKKSAGKNKITEKLRQIFSFNSEAPDSFRLDTKEIDEALA
jgi:hypothetical protein